MNNKSPSAAALGDFIIASNVSQRLPCGVSAPDLRQQPDHMLAGVLYGLIHGGGKGRHAVVFLGKYG